MTTPALTPEQAYDQARAGVMRQHVYVLDNESAMSECSCGEKVAVIDVGRHIEKAVEKAGIAALDEDDDGAPS